MKRTEGYNMEAEDQSEGAQELGIDHCMFSIGGGFCFGGGSGCKRTGVIVVIHPSGYYEVANPALKRAVNAIRAVNVTRKNTGNGDTSEVKPNK